MSTLEQYARILLGLHKRFTPHDGQIAIGRALFNDKIKDIFVESGRNFGKTAIAIYLLWRYAKMNPGSQNYYFAPYMKQAREIVWAPRLMQDFGPPEWISDDPNKTEMRVVLTNGSFIKCDGSDNVDSYRGVKPQGLIVLDEFKDFRPEFLEAFDPNRAAYNAPMIIFGTPPNKKNQFSVVKESYKKDSAKKYFHAPTWMNPHISREWLLKKKHELMARGDMDVWQREYEAIEVYGGSQKIFSMIDKAMVRPHEEVMHIVRRNFKRLEFILFTDPAAASIFGVLFACYNPYTSEVFVLDEIYETAQEQLTVNVMGRRITEKRESFFPKDVEWRQGYDEAATWFAHEMLDNFEEHYEPSMKAKNDKESGLTLIKDMMLSGKLIFSDRCEKLFWELDNYYKDKNGNIPKKDDHLIDCLRYILAALHYSLPERQDIDEGFEGRKGTISRDFPQFAGLERKLT